MGMAIIEETGFFDPVLYGLQIGTLIQVIAVGGGGGGGAGRNSGGYTVSPDAGRAAGAETTGGGGAGYGGGGGGGFASADLSGGGGGGGGYLKVWSGRLTNLESIPVTIGAGGTGAPGGATDDASNGKGKDGGTTSFGNFVTAQGGAGGSGSTRGSGGTYGGSGAKGCSGGGGGGYVIGCNIRGNGGRAGLIAGAIVDANKKGEDGVGTGGAGGGEYKTLSASSSLLVTGGPGKGGPLGGGNAGQDGGPGHGVVVVTW